MTSQRWSRNEFVTPEHLLMALDIPHLVMGILQLKESCACYLLKDALANKESKFMMKPGSNS